MSKDPEGRIESSQEFGRWFRPCLERCPRKVTVSVVVVWVWRGRWWCGVHVVDIDVQEIPEFLQVAIGQWHVIRRGRIPEGQRLQTRNDGDAAECGVTNVPVSLW